MIYLLLIKECKKLFQSSRGSIYRIGIGSNLDRTFLTMYGYVYTWNPVSLMLEIL